MRYLFFTNTPAHVHLYKHAIDDLRERGHEVLVLAREYTCTVDLLEWEGLPYAVYGSCGTTKRSLLRRLPGHYVRAIRLARRFDPDLIFGMGGYAAHTGAVTRTPTVLFIDSEPADFDHMISTPFARTILTPNTFRKELGERHYVFPGLKECAYLHPNSYEPNPQVRDRLGLEAEDRYAILRLNAFGSQHDVGKEGITGADRQHIIEQLSEDVTVFVSDESGDADLSDSPAEPFELHPALLHDALAAADLLVADTQTMVTEAALLGTPAVRSNSFVGDDDMGNFLTLEKQGLISNVTSVEEILECATAVLADPDAETIWQRRREAFLSETVDLTQVLVDVALAGGSVEDCMAVRQFGGSVRRESADAVGVHGD